MNNRKKQLYKKIFRFLKDEIHINPEQLMMDFEFSARKAAKEVWNGIEIRGCNFHFAQALRRKAKTFPRLSFMLRQNQAARTALNMYIRLSILLANRVTAVFRVNLNQLF